MKGGGGASLGRCTIVKWRGGYNARAVEGPVTAGYERPTSQFGNNNEKRAGTKKEGRRGEREKKGREEGGKKMYRRDVIKAGT